MDNNIRWVNKKKIEKTIDALNKNGMCGYLVEGRDELIQKIKDLVPKGSLVGCGGSASLLEMKVIDFIREYDYEFLDRYESGLSKEELKNLHRKSFFADAYFTSTNAITQNGELYNVDGNGNRVAAMLYGPDKVIVVCGVNKIVKNIEEAITRNEQISAPANTKRLNTKTPCKETGYCMDCSSMDRICCEYTVIKKQRTLNRIHVIFINENLGY